MNCNCHSIVHRATVTFADKNTGEIRVKIPQILGNNSEVSISRLTRAKYNGVWVVPNVGDQIVVSADDAHMSNLFWLHSDLTPAKTILPSNNYGSFYDTTTQTNPVANTVNIMTLNSSADHNLIDIVDGSKIAVTNTGIFNIQFSAQFDKTDSGTDDFDIWLRIDGVDVPWSNTRITTTGNSVKVVAAWNWMVAMNAGQYAQIAWSSADTSMRIFAQGPQTGPIRPAIPSVIVTVQRTV